MKVNETIETINRAIDRLQASYDCNHEFMDADDCGDLLSTIASLKAIRIDLTPRDISIYTPYSEEHDMTFIMEDTFVNGDLKATECIGWYMGEPNPEDTSKYAGTRMRATY